MRVNDVGTDSLQVVIKPGAGTQLSLELRQHGGGVEVQAALQQGDFKHLSQHWPELQQRLEQRGIRLAPLTDDGTLANGGSGTFQTKPESNRRSVGRAWLRNTQTGTLTQPTVARKSGSGLGNLGMNNN